jgi:hypothetical protein
MVYTPRFTAESFSVNTRVHQSAQYAVKYLISKSFKLLQFG